MDPGAVLLALLGSAEPLVAPAGLRAVRLDASRRTRSPGRAAARRSSGSRARRRRSSPRPTATTPSARSIPWLGRRAERGRGDPQRLDHRARGRSGVTNCLNFGDPTRPEAFWQLAEARPRARRRVPRARPARHRRQRLALQRVAGGLDRPDAGDRRRRAARRRRDARRPGVRGPRATRSSSSARRRPASPAASTRGSPGVARGGRPAGARPRAGGGGPGVRPRAAIAAASSPPPRTCRAAAWPSPSRNARCGATRIGAAGPAPPASAIAGGRAVRREPVAARRLDCDRGTSRRSSCSPASTASRSRTLGVVGGDSLVIELAGAGATGAAEERGSRVADALEVAARRPPPRLGARACRGPSAGRAD